MTPYEAWCGRKPGVSYLRTFGCVAHVKNVKPHLKKLEDRSTPMVFVGYEAGSKAYRVFDPVTDRVHVTRDVIFDEQAQWDWGLQQPEVGKPPSAGPFTVEHSTVVATGMPGGEPNSEAHGAAQSAPSIAKSTTSTLARTSPRNSEIESAGDMAPTGDATSPAVIPEFASPPIDARETFDADHDDDAPVRFRTLDNIIGPAPVPNLARRELISQLGDLLLTSAEEPASFQEAEQSQPWRRAMLDEMKSVEANQTWELVDPPAGCRPIGLKWV